MTSRRQFVENARLILPAVLLAIGASAAHAQDDVTRLGARFGTEPPAEYRALRAADPGAFGFERAWFRRNPRLDVVETGGVPEVRMRGPIADGGGARGMAAARVDGRDVSGTITFPLFLGLYSDDGAPEFTRAEVHEKFFAGPNPTGTIPEYYAEISRGRLAMVGETVDWARTGLTRAQVTGGSSGLGGSSRVGEFIMQLLTRADQQGMDWGRFDNDGPDGIPNSGDDDGYVDVIGVMHADFGGECGGDGGDDRVWSHRWTLRSAVGQAYVTSTASANGSPIRVSDYTIQPVRYCGGERMNDIGVFAHELGHGLGLPDLYAVSDGSSPDHEGIGAWGLMGGGSWGCSNSNAARPCHMSAWSKRMLGWADVVELAPESDLATVSIPPVETTGTVYRWEIPGADHYYLLENRQPIGFDGDLLAPGLLVWYIDDEVVERRWPANRVNSNPQQMGVRVVEADGRDDMRLGGRNRGDTGDPFPGVTGATAFTAGSTPASRTPSGDATRLTVENIQLSGESVSARLRTRTYGLTLTNHGAPAHGPAFTVDGEVVSPGTVVRLAPWETVTVRAPEGLQTGPGTRLGFEGWSDGTPSAERTVGVEDSDLTITALFGGEQVLLTPDFVGGRYGVEPGRLETTPHSEDLWFDRGTEIEVRIVETPGFLFRELTGELSGRTPPFDLTLNDPATVGAAFDFVYGIDSETLIPLAGGDDVALDLSVTEGSGPIEWSVESGSLPSGLEFDPVGRIEGIALSTGNFFFTVRAVDTNGLTALARLTLEIARPELDPSILAGPFLGTGASPTNGQLIWLDTAGNVSGSYDIDDLRRYILAAPSTAAVHTTGTAELRIELQLKDPRGVGGPDAVSGGGR